MTEWFSPFIECVVETFPIRSPLFEFGYNPDGPGAESDLGIRCAGEKTGAHPGVVQSVTVEQLDDLTRLPYADGSVPTVVCCGAMEHVFEPRRAAEEMIRILKPGGILVMAALGCGAKNRPAGPCWHFTPNSMQRLLSDLDATLIGWQGSEMGPHTVFGIGSKGPVTGHFVSGASLFVDQFQQYLDRQKQSHGWVRQLKRRLVDWVCGAKGTTPPADFYQVRFMMHMATNLGDKQSVLKTCLPEPKTGSRLDLSQ